MPPLPLQDERKAAERREGGLVNYRQQIGFAVHVLAMMAAFYAFGHVAGMALTSNRVLVRQWWRQLPGGFCGLVPQQRGNGCQGTQMAGLRTAALPCATGWVYVTFSWARLARRGRHGMSPPASAVCVVSCPSVQGATLPCVPLPSPRAQHPIIGLVFMTSALVLETVLFIIRTTVPPKLHREAARRAVAARVAKQQERHLSEQRRGAGASSSGGGPGGEAGTSGGSQGGARQAAGTGRATKPAGEKKDD